MVREDTTLLEEESLELLEKEQGVHLQIQTKSQLLLLLLLQIENREKQPQAQQLKA